MASGTHNPTEWLSTITETIERHTDSGNLDCRGGQTVRDSGTGEYDDAPKEAGEYTSHGNTGRYTDDRKSRHLGHVQRYAGRRQNTGRGSNKDITDSPPVVSTLRNTHQDGSGPRTILVGGGQLHLHKIQTDAKEEPTTRR